MFKRLFVLLLALVALPALVVLHRQWYFLSEQGKLESVIAQTLAEDAEYREVKASMQYLDVSLSGMAPSPMARARVREALDDLPGVRSRDQDNRIQVLPKIDAQLEAPVFTLSGWMKDGEDVAALVDWIKTVRPDLQVNTEGVSKHPFVTEAPLPSSTDIPEMYRGLWTLMEFPPALKVFADEAGFHLQGKLPAGPLLDAVKNVLLEARPAYPVDASRMETGISVKQASFTKADTLAAFLMTFFGCPGARSFSVDDSGVQLAGDFLPSEVVEWESMLEPVAAELSVAKTTALYRSHYHMPGHQMVSDLSTVALEELDTALATQDIVFEPGYESLQGPQLAKLNWLAATFLQAGSGVRIIVGVHPDTEGDPVTNQTMAQKRAASTITALGQRGVPAERLEATVFEIVPDETVNHSLRLECLVK